MYFVLKIYETQVLVVWVLTERIPLPSLSYVTFLLESYCCTNVSPVLTSSKNTNTQYFHSLWTNLISCHWLCLYQKKQVFKSEIICLIQGRSRIIFQDRMCNIYLYEKSHFFSRHYNKVWASSSMTAKWGAFYTFGNKNLKTLVERWMDIRCQHLISANTGKIKTLLWFIPTIAGYLLRCSVLTVKQKPGPILTRKGAFCVGHRNSVGPVVIMRCHPVFLCSSVSAPIIEWGQELMRQSSVISFMAGCYGFCKSLFPRRKYFISCSNCESKLQSRSLQPQPCSHCNIHSSSLSWRLHAAGPGCKLVWTWDP